MSTCCLMMFWSSFHSPCPISRIPHACGSLFYTPGSSSSLSASSICTLHGTCGHSTTQSTLFCHLMWKDCYWAIFFPHCQQNTRNIWCIDRISKAVSNWVGQIDVFCFSPKTMQNYPLFTLIIWFHSFFQVTLRYDWGVVPRLNREKSTKRVTFPIIFD